MSVGTVLSVALAVFAVRAWRQQVRGLAGRIHYSAVTAAALLGSGLWWIALVQSPRRSQSSLQAAPLRAQV